MVNWLHISDLHLGSEGTITNMMRDELPGYLRELEVNVTMYSVLVTFEQRM